MNTYMITVCQECLMVHANGVSEGLDASQPAPWALWEGETHRVAMGGAPHRYLPVCEPEDGCDCDDAGFSWSPCEGCGSTLGGDRYTFTVFES